MTHFIKDEFSHLETPGKKLYARRNKKGCCIRCSSPLSANPQEKLDHKVCSACRLKMGEYSKKWYANKPKEGKV